MEIKSDVLTESEKQFFIDKILFHYHERDAKYFIEQFEYFPDDYLKQDFARIDSGFAVLKSNASAFLWGKFYVVKNNDFYRVVTNLIEGSKTHERAGTRVTSIQVNGFEKVTDENIRSNFEAINQFFALQAWNDALGIKS